MSAIRRACALSSSVVSCLATLGLVLSALAVPGTARAQDPNPVLDEGVDCEAIKASAQSTQSDAYGPDGDNWGATGACMATVTQEGWGYDYKQVSLWLAPNGSGGQNLYVCTELFGLPGDADADGGYASNNSSCDGAFGPTCGGSEGAGDEIVGPSEEITLEIDPRCSAVFEPRLRIQLRNDLLFVAANSMGAGPPFPTILGAQGQVWEAAPLVAAGLDSVPTCLDASIRRGAVIFCIANFDDFFTADASWNPNAFNWKVIGGHSADQLSEDSVVGTFRDLNPDLAIEKTVAKSELCGADATTFTLLVSNPGNVSLVQVVVTDELPAGLTYTGPSGECTFGAPNQVGNELRWGLGLLGPGESRSCTFGVSSEDCSGPLQNIARVTGQVANVCEEPLSLTAADTAYIQCVEPCVEIAAADTQACGVEFVEVPVTITNCFNRTSDIRLECTLNGQALGTIEYTGVLAQGTRTRLVEVSCASSPATLFCRAILTPSGGPEGCTAVDSVTAIVTCVQPGVRVNVVGSDICVAQATPLPVLVRNTSTLAEDIRLRCFVDGALADDRLLEDVGGGDSVTVVLTVSCDGPDTLDIVCEATATVVGREGCTTQSRDVTMVRCQTPGVDIDKDTSPRILEGMATSKVTLVVRNTGTSILDPVRVHDVLPDGLVLAADPQVMATCDTRLSGNVSFAEPGQLLFEDFVLGPGEQCVIMYRVACDGSAPGDTLINRATVQAWCDGTYDSDPPVLPVSDADTAWVLCEQDEMECPEPQNICFWQDQCPDGPDEWLLASLDGRSDDDSGRNPVVCSALMEHIARCVVERSTLLEWQRDGMGPLNGTELRSILDDGVLVRLLCEQLVNDRSAGLRELGEGQYLTLLMNVCAWALSPGNPVDTRGYVGTVGGVISGLAEALNAQGDVKHWTEVACSVNNGIGVFVPEECKPECDRGCTFTQGYWKNHPGAWPTTTLSLGTVNYSQAQLLSILKTPVAGNGLISLAHQLIAAKLNAANGTSVPAGVHTAIMQADLLIGTRVVPPIGGGYLAPGATSELAGTLDGYNNGFTGPGHCDEGDDRDDHSGDDHSGDDHTGDDHSGDDHSGDDHSGDNHSGDNHTGDDHSDRVDNHRDDDSSDRDHGRKNDDHDDDSDSGRRDGRGRSRHGAPATWSSDDGSDQQGGEDCCSLTEDPGNVGGSPLVAQFGYKKGGPQGGSGGRGDDGKPYGCCGEEGSRDDDSGDDHSGDDRSGDDHSGDDHSGHDSALTGGTLSPSGWNDWGYRNRDDHSGDDRSGDDHSGDDHSGDDHSDDDHSGDDPGGDDHSGDDDSGDHDGGNCEDGARSRPAFIDKMALCPAEAEDDDDSSGDDHGRAVSTQAVGPGVTGGIQTLSIANYPNPVQLAPMTILLRVPVHLEAVGQADVGVYDVSGRQVKRLEVGLAGSGEYRVEWDLTDETGRRVSSGIYFTRLRVGPEQQTQRILVVRQ